MAMEKDVELRECLREIMQAVNTEARLAGPATLNRAIDSICDGVGLEWALKTAQALGVVGVAQVTQNPTAYRDMVRSDEGRRELKVEVDRRRKEVQEYRRRVVAHIRAWQTGPTDLEFRCEAQTDAEGIYRLLVDSSQKPAMGGPHGT